MTLRQASSVGSSQHTSSPWRRRIWAVKPVTLPRRYDAAIVPSVCWPALPFNHV